MNRLAALLLLCALVAVAAVVGAPAPLPSPSRVWTARWDEAVDPVGGCRFDRTGEKLTITASGKGHEHDLVKRRLNAPCLLRDVAGSFVVQVRVGGDFRSAGKTADKGWRAGLVVADGDNLILVER